MYSGDLEGPFCYGPGKVEAIEQIARLAGHDLGQSYAYSDSASDLPMLRAVGHPVAVNPDRELLRSARRHGWEVCRFARKVPLRERVPMPAPRDAAIGGGAAALAIGAGIVAWWWLDKGRPSPSPA